MWKAMKMKGTYSERPYLSGAHDQCTILPNKNKPIQEHWLEWSYTSFNFGGIIQLVILLDFFLACDLGKRTVVSISNIDFPSDKFSCHDGLFSYKHACQKDGGQIPLFWSSIPRSYILDKFRFIFIQTLITEIWRTNPFILELYSSIL